MPCPLIDQTLQNDPTSLITLLAIIRDGPTGHKNAQHKDIRYDPYQVLTISSCHSQVHHSRETSLKVMGILHRRGTNNHHFHVVEWFGIFVDTGFCIYLCVTSALWAVAVYWKWIEVTQGNYHQSFHQIEYMKIVEMRVLNSLQTEFHSSHTIRHCPPTEPSSINFLKNQIEKNQDLSTYFNLPNHDMEVVIKWPPTMQENHWIQDLQNCYQTEVLYHILYHP